MEGDQVILSKIDRYKAACSLWSRQAGLSTVFIR